MEEEKNIINIKDYILYSKEERQSHLDLESPCIEGTSKWSSTNKKRLAEFLHTTLPSGRILTCHACNNAKCTNIKHLYFGTDYENIIEDGRKFGTQEDVWSRTTKRYSKEEIHEIHGRGNKAAGGKANKGTPKSEAHKRKLSIAAKEAHKRLKHNIY